MSEISAETIRNAATLMREHAKAATDGPWAWEATGDKDNSWALGLVCDESEQPIRGQLEHGQGVVVDGVCESINGHLSDAEHIASWHPGVALAVAAWLESAVDDPRCGCSLPNCADPDALAVARAYLGC